MTIRQNAAIILASGSAIRQQMLKAVGLTFSVTPSNVDEEMLQQSAQHLPIPQQALTLARAKALQVSEANPEAYVIGADQMCALDARIFSKPGTLEAAQAQLALLAGKTHTQNCGSVIARGGKITFEIAATAKLTMRPLSAAEIRAYVMADQPTASCGAYKFEALGRHLFTAVEGDQDVIKGLALLPVLAALHAQGAIALA